MACRLTRLSAFLREWPSHHPCCRHPSRWRRKSQNPAQKLSHRPGPVPDWQSTV